MPPETVAASIIIMIWVLEWPTKCTVRTMSSTKLEASIKKAWDDCLAQNTRLVSEWGPHFHLPWHTAGLDSQASRSSFRTWGTVLVTFLQMQDVIRLKMWSRHCVMLQAWCSHGQVEPAVFQLWWSEFPVHEKQMQLMQMMPTFHGHGRARIVVSWYLPNSLMLNSSDQAATVPGKRKLHCTMQVRNLHLPKCKFPARALPKNGITCNHSGGKKILHPAEAERKKADGQICLSFGWKIDLDCWICCSGRMSLLALIFVRVKYSQVQRISTSKYILLRCYCWSCSCTSTFGGPLACPGVLWHVVTLSVYLYQALDNFAWIYHQ